MVLAHHSVNIVASPFRFQNFKDDIDLGSEGVALFFVISAYTLVRSWNIRATREALPARKFYLRRAFRILPFWWLNIAINLYLRPRPFSFLIVLSNATLTFGFFASTFPWSIVPYGWSLCVEETFYWFFPAWMKIIKTIPGTLYVIFLFVVGSQVWETYGHFLFEEVNNPEFYFGFPLDRFYIFFLGLLAWQLQSNSQFQNLIKKLERLPTPILDLILGVFIYYLLPYGTLCGSLVVFLLLLVAKIPKTLVGRLVRLRWLGALGITCFSMYLLHWYPLLWFKGNQEQFFRWLSLPNIGEVHFSIIFIISLSTTFLMSVISYRLIELPTVQLGKAVAKRIWPNRT